MAGSMKGIITVLGSPNDNSGKLYSIAIERCNEAIKMYKSNPGWKIVLTGGFGQHFNTTDKPHAFYLNEYLVEHGIPESDILEFVESSNTLEDASLLKPIIFRYEIAAEHHSRKEKHSLLLNPIPWYLFFQFQHQK